jgi:hypothetical protein
LAVSLAFSFLGGFPPYFYYICLFVSVYYLFLILFSLSDYNFKDISLRLLPFAGAFVLMAGLVGVQLLPTVELTQRSVHRISERLTSEQIGILGRNLFSLAQMPSNYMRDYSVAIFLIPLAFVSKKNRPVVVALLALLVCSMLFVLSNRVPSLALFGKIPFANLFRIPERVMVFQDFIIGVVGATGLSLLQSGDAPMLWSAGKTKQIFSWIYISICILALPFSLLLDGAKLVLQSPTYALIHTPWISVVLILLLCISKASSRFKVAGTLCSLLCVLLALSIHRDMLAPVSSQAVVLNSFLVAFTVILFISAFAFRLPAWVKESCILAIAAIVILNFAQHRNIKIRKPVPALTEVNGYDSLFDKRIEWIKNNAGYDRVLLAGEGTFLIVPDADLGYLYQFHHINSYEPFTQTRWKLFIRSVMGAKEFDKTIERFMFYGIINSAIRDSFLREPQVIGLTSLRYVATLRPISKDKIQSGWNLIHGSNSRDFELTVFENRFALSRAYLANNYQVIQDDKAALEAIHQNESPWLSPVILEDDSPTFSSAEFPTNPGSVRIREYGINEVELEVEADEPCLVVLTDGFYPGWKAFVDGDERPVLRANFLFRAVEVAPGSHSVVFRYMPASVLRGAIISLASLLLIFAGLLLERRYTKMR